jgi:bacterioferritin-associated ferredoxin
MRIDRCICFGVTFDRCKTFSAVTPGCSLQELGEQLGVGTKCGLCKPYLAAMLRSGETCFTYLLKKEPNEAEHPTGSGGESS